jgi:hypothetical protein
LPFFFAALGCQWEVERLAGCQSLRERAEVEMAAWSLHKLSIFTVASDVSETFKFLEGEIPMVSCELKLPRISSNFSTVLFSTLRWSIWLREVMQLQFNEHPVCYMDTLFFFKIALFLQDSWLKARGGSSTTAFLRQELG